MLLRIITLLKGLSRLCIPVDLLKFSGKILILDLCYQIKWQVSAFFLLVFSPNKAGFTQ